MSDHVASTVASRSLKLDKVSYYISLAGSNLHIPKYGLFDCTPWILNLLLYSISPSVVLTHVSVNKENFDGTLIGLQQ